MIFMDATTTPAQPTAPSRGLRETMRQHPLLAFFVMAYAFSWIMSIPCILAEWGLLPAPVFNLFFIIKAFAGPFVAALIMTNILEGKEGVLRLRRRLFQTRAGWHWYVLILLAIPALFLLGIAVQPGALASFTGFPNNSLVAYLITYLVNFVIIFFFGGPLAEEPGWRGFALPRTQARYADRRFGPLWGALLLGLVWAFWHLPDFLTSAQGGGPGTGWGEFFTNLPIFVVMVVAINIVMTWVYNHTQGSLFIAMLLHASINTSGILPKLFPAPTIPIMTLANIALLVGILVPAVLVALLTRGQLGYKPTI
jgi:uncharacterized protein